MVDSQKREDWENVVLSPVFESNLSRRAPDIYDLIYPDLKRALEKSTKKNLLIVARYALPVRVHELRIATKRIIEEDGIRKGANVFFLNEEINQAEPVYLSSEEPEGQGRTN